MIFRNGFRPSKVLRCIYGSEKWIPDKIPHRNGYPQKNSQLFCCRKKIFFENENFGFEKYFCSFSKNIFFHEKKTVEKKFGLSYRCGILSGIRFWYL